VDARAEFVSENVVYAALTCDAIQTIKRARNNPYTEMRFAFGTRTGMASMLRAVVDYIKFDG
jgi:hypothetical protein